MSSPHRTAPGPRPAPEPTRGLLARGRLALAALWFTLLASYRRRAGGRAREAGDVPGWVMVTLMSALLVAGLFIVAGPELEKLFKAAISKVSGM